MNSQLYMYWENNACAQCVPARPFLLLLKGPRYEAKRLLLVHVTPPVAVSANQQKRSKLGAFCALGGICLLSVLVEQRVKAKGP